MADIRKQQLLSTTVDYDENIGRKNQLLSDFENIGRKNQILPSSSSSYSVDGMGVIESSSKSNLMTDFVNDLDIYSLGSLVSWDLLLLFGIGSVVMRGAGCIINDLWDKDIDKRVERTRGRPLASGKISTKEAIGFLAIQLSIGLVILTRLDLNSIILGSLSLVPVIAYPLMKRITYWPQAVLGIAFNWGALLGWSSVFQGQMMDWSVTIPLYAAGIFWTLVYDTIYAHQDKRDDVKASVKSTALLFGKKTKPVLLVFTFASMISLLFAAQNNGISLSLSSMSFYGILSGASFHLAWQILKADLDNPKSCFIRFKRCQWFGAICSFGIYFYLMNGRPMKL